MIILTDKQSKETEIAIVAVVISRRVTHGCWNFLHSLKKKPFTGGLNSFICFYISPKHQRGCCYYTQILTNMKRIQSFFFYCGTSGPGPTLTNYLSKAQIVRSLRTFNKAQ